MSLAKKFATFVAPMALAAGFSLAANDAAALDLKPGQCLPAAEMMSQLKAEGQRSVIFANRVWADQEKKLGGRRGNIFTSNASGNLGYQIEAKDSYIGSDKPATSFCLVDSYTNISLYNAKGNGLPKAIPSSSNLAKVVKNEISERGAKPMMVAEHNGVVIVVSGNLDKKGVNGVIFEGTVGVDTKAGSAGELADVAYSSNISRDTLPTAEDQKLALN